MKIRCKAPSERPKFDGQQCGGFAGDAPEGAVFLGLLDPPGEKGSPDNLVLVCVRCRSLHEFGPPLVDAIRLLAA